MFIILIINVNPQFCANKSNSINIGKYDIAIYKVCAESESANKRVMASWSVKVHLLRDDEKVLEIRRFPLTETVTFAQLYDRVQRVFPDLHGRKLNLSWKGMIFKIKNTILSVARTNTLNEGSGISRKMDKLYLKK